MSLSELFLAHASGGARESLSTAPELEADLTTLVETARAAWPALSVPNDVFMRAVAGGLPPAGDAREAVRGTHAADLYLACACARGDAAAVAALEERQLAPLWAQLARSKAFLRFDEDARQQLRARLLVGDGGSPGRIASYAGRGPLAAWLSVAATRLAVDLRRIARPQQSLEDVARRIGSAEIDPELGYLKARYGRHVEDALREALGLLSARDSALLRLYYFDELTAAAIAQMYRVTRRTVHRWLEDILARLVSESRRLLAERLRLSTTELDSLVGLVQSQIALTLHPPHDSSDTQGPNDRHT